MPRAPRVPVPTPAEPMTDEHYVAINGARCPFCNSTDLEGDGTDYGMGSVSNEVTCNNCHAEWYDCYKLTCYEVIRHPSGFVEAPGRDEEDG